MDWPRTIEVREIAKRLSRTKKRRALRGKKIYVRHEKREGWTAQLPIYLFWCPACEHWALDYPHGHIDRQYLTCSCCKASHRFVPWKVEIKIFFSYLRLILSLLKRRLAKINFR